MSVLFMILISLMMTLFSEMYLFPIDAIVFWCPTWSKNLGRTLFGSPTPMKVKCWIFSVLIMSLSFIQIQNEIASLYINQLSRQIEISLIACQCTFICQRLYIISFFLMERNQKNLVTTKSSNYVVRFQGPVCVK